MASESACGCSVRSHCANNCR